YESNLTAVVACHQMIQHRYHGRQTYAAAQQHDWRGAFIVQGELALRGSQVDHVALFYVGVQNIGHAAGWRIGSAILAFDRNAQAAFAWRIRQAVLTWLHDA